MTSTICLQGSGLTPLAACHRYSGKVLIITKPNYLDILCNAG
jgi:hypothetical protein